MQKRNYGLYGLIFAQWKNCCAALQSYITLIFPRPSFFQNSPWLLLADFQIVICVSVSDVCGRSQSRTS